MIVAFLQSFLSVQTVPYKQAVLQDYIILYYVIMLIVKDSSAVTFRGSLSSVRHGSVGVHLTRLRALCARVLLLHAV